MTAQPGSKQSSKRAPMGSLTMPEVRVGIPSVIHAALLPRLIGVMPDGVFAQLDL
jgi:hypothetical protein